jgi:hypothetical protein
MQNRSPAFFFYPNYNFGTDNLFVLQSSFGTGHFPPPVSNFLLLNGGPFGLLNGGNLLLL